MPTYMAPGYVPVDLNTIFIMATLFVGLFVFGGVLLAALGRRK